MEKINKLFGDAEMVQYREPKKPELPPTETLLAIKKWSKMLQGCYNNRELDNEGVVVWAGLLGNCKPEVMEAVIKDWMATEPKPPKPAELLERYKYRRKEAAGAKTAAYVTADTPDGEPLYKCPYCYDTGFLAFERGKPDMYGDTDYWPCSCEQKLGGLGAILGDPRYWWDAAKKRFSLKWAGDKGGVFFDTV